MSSANIILVLFWKKNSFMKIRNKIGAKWDPWRTPEVECVGIDQNSLYATIFCRSIIK